MTLLKKMKKEYRDKMLDKECRLKGTQKFAIDALKTKKYIGDITLSDVNCILNILDNHNISINEFYGLFKL